mgnify:CR=1 FL=1
MKIAVDAGNSRIKWGVHDGVSWVQQGSVPTEDAAALAGVASGWHGKAHVMVCSVAGPNGESANASAKAERD